MSAEDIARKCAEKIRPDHIDKRDWHDHSQPFILAAISEATEHLQRENEQLFNYRVSLETHQGVLLKLAKLNETLQEVGAQCNRAIEERDRFQRERDELRKENELMHRQIKDLRNE